MTLTAEEVIAALTRRMRDLEDRVLAIEGPKARFQIPSLSEVTTYCKERMNSIDPEYFIDHYESNGWTVGKSKMKSWQATIRKWEKNNGLQGQTSGGAGGRGRTETRSFYERAEEQSRQTERGARALLGVLGGSVELHNTADKNRADTRRKSAIDNPTKLISKVETP